MPTDEEFLFGDYAHQQGPYAYSPAAKPLNWSARVSKQRPADMTVDPSAEVGSFRDTEDQMLPDSYPKGGAISARTARDT